MEPGGAIRHETVAQDASHLAQAAAELLAAKISGKRGIFRLVVAGGSTPRALYAHLAGAAFRGRLDWNKLEIFWGDERFVPHDHPDSNYRMVRETLLDHLRIDPRRVHPMPTVGEPDACAREYEALLRQRYGRPQLDPAIPLFDVVLLGLGTDGHTASLLPGQPVLRETSHWVAAVPRGREEPRLTLTYPAIESSRCIVFLVTGAEKTKAVAGVRAGDERLPATRIRSVGEILWFLDCEAAGAALTQTRSAERHAGTD
jgi:6-phosphogluconolactonase